MSVYLTLTFILTNPMLQMVLELCQSKQVTDRETVDMHLERIRSLVSTWAAQVRCFFSPLFWGLVCFLITLSIILSL